MKSYLFLGRALLLGCLMPLLVLAAPLSAAAESDRSLFLDQAEDDVLPPEQAFQLAVSARDAHTLQASFKVAPGHYLYRDRIKFSPAASENSSYSISNIALPKGDLKEDAYFGRSEVYHQDVDAVLTLSYPGSMPQTISLNATYQGCSEKGLCYSPIHKTIKVNLSGSAVGGVQTSDAGSATGDGAAASLLKNGKLWLVITGFFGFGVLLSLTPCVLPMIPILSSIIVGRQHFGKLHTFNLSLAYTLGMATSYAAVGIAAGLTGRLLSNALQTPWALGFGALIFTLLAFSMFGFYELTLPSSLESRLVGASNRIKGGRFLGVFAMGALASLIVSPCVAAPLAGALLYISKTHDVVLGGTALFALAIGMGVPLLLIGASAGTLLPKAGPWMTAIRNFFGVVMLAMAIWLVSPLMPVPVAMALWAALLIISAIYLHALDNLPPNAGHWSKLGKGVGVIALVSGVLLLLGAASGAKSPLQPLAGFGSASSAAEARALPFHRVQNLAEVKSLVQQAGKPVMLDFYADWCVACKELELNTFSDPRVQQALQNALLLQADVTANSAADVELLQHYGLFGPPGIIFFDPHGNELSHARIIGFQDAETFLTHLAKLGLK